MNESNSSNSSIGLGTVLFLVFLVLKLVGVITWSWWWVTSPLWISFALVMFVVILISIFSGNNINKRRW